jgi:hypothetical protein
MIHSQGQSPFSKVLSSGYAWLAFLTTTLSSMERERIQNGNSTLTRTVGAGKEKMKMK